VIREVGTLITLSTVVRDSVGVVTNTPTVTITVTGPTGSTATPSGVTNTAANGVYTATITPDVAGVYLYRWTAAGTVVDVQSDQFTVVASQRALIASAEELKAHMNRTDITDDAELRTHLVAATDWIERAIGGPVSVQTFTEYVPVSGWWIVPAYKPLVSVTSLTPQLGAALDSSAFVVDTLRNGIRILWGAFTGWYTLVYRAGYSPVPERIKLAGLILAAHLWQTQNGGGGLPYPGDSEMAHFGQGFAVPNRVKELLAPDRIPGIA
jgi:hypothetical protein